MIRQIESMYYNDCTVSRLQIGLDPDQEDLALFQCFYRWGG